MTDTTETTTTEAEGTTAVAPEAPETTETAQEDTKGGREAAKYRTRLRDAEAERDAAAAALDAASLAAVTATLNLGVVVTPPPARGARTSQPETAVLHDASDLMRYAGKSAREFMGDDGEVDADMVTAAVAELRAERPYLFKPSGNRAPLMGRTPAPRPRTGGFEAAFAHRAD